ncbi:MAG: DUF1569 domain-containing protein [Chitinophagaceae bacterium]|nr:DUF1569 domain-containing protein [Chitinophagaceae bacterium]
MEIKNLFDPAVKQEIVDRIEHLIPQSPRQWGKMNVAQMLAHLQLPMGIALGTHTVKGNWLMRLVLPLFKSKLYDDNPWKKGLPTDKSFIMTGSEKNFEAEKAKLLDMINRFTEANIKSEKHPIFGHLTREQWSKATWKHIDHHLKQFGA